MNVGDCYRLLELDRSATLADIKASYRRLAREYHPDLNDCDGAHDRFIELQDAYEKLCAIAPLEPSEVAEMAERRRGAACATQRPETAPPRATSPPEAPPQSEASAEPLPELDRQLKYDAYEKLGTLLSEERFPRAVALVEGLAERLPGDPEVRQWQAVTYQCCGRYHLDRDRLAKARTYLTKAYRTDPHNRELLGVVAQDLRRLERLYQQKRQKQGGGRTVAIPDFFKTKHDPEHPTVRPTPAKRKRSGRKSKSSGKSGGKSGSKRAPRGLFRRKK